MIVSTKGRYALRVMIDLAEHQAERYVPLKEVAERQEISEKYLENILKVLVQNGFLEGLRLPADPHPRPVHCGRDPAADRGQPCPRELPCARCSRLRTAAQLPHLYDVEGPERHDCRLLWQDHSGRPRRTRSGRE